MAEPTETVEHPVFGSLAWFPDFDHWFGQYQLPTGEWLDVIVTPGEGDRYTSVEVAVGLFQWALKNERRILADAMRSELLDMYNGTWRGEDEPELTEDELTARLDWQLMAINTYSSPVVQVEFSYRAAGDLFGGHGVTIEVDEQLAFRDIDLRG